MKYLIFLFLWLPHFVYKRLNNFFRHLSMPNPGDKSLNKTHAGVALVKTKTWIKLFLFPIFVFLFISAVLVVSLKLKWSNPFIILLVATGFVCGILFAQKISKKHGLIEADTKHLESGDIDKWTTEKNSDGKN